MNDEREAGRDRPLLRAEIVLEVVLRADEEPDRLNAELADVVQLEADWNEGEFVPFPVDRELLIAERNAQFWIDRVGEDRLDLGRPIRVGTEQVLVEDSVGPLPF